MPIPFSSLSSCTKLKSFVGQDTLTQYPSLIRAPFTAAVVTRDQCGAVYNHLLGHIAQTPTVSGASNCHWTLQGPPGSVLLLEFHKLYGSPEANLQVKGLNALFLLHHFKRRKNTRLLNHHHLNLKQRHIRHLTPSSGIPKWSKSYFYSQISDSESVLKIEMWNSTSPQPAIVSKSNIVHVNVSARYGFRLSWKGMFLFYTFLYFLCNLHSSIHSVLSIPHVQCDACIHLGTLVFFFQ